MIKQATAKEKFYALGADEEKDPVERLRFFCSLAMNSQDWVDVEPFFDAIKQQGDAIAKAKREALLEASKRLAGTPAACDLEDMAKEF